MGCVWWRRLFWTLEEALPMVCRIEAILTKTGNFVLEYFLTS